MYASFFGFLEKPFNIIPNPAYLYPSSKHRMAITYLQYGLSENIGFILLTGEIGIGKTTLVRHMLADLNAKIEVAVLFNTNFAAEDLVKYVLREFEVEPAGSDKSANMDKLNSFLIHSYSRGKRPLLIIDEAQNLSLEALEEVRMLSNLQTDRDSLLQIMLIGQPELRMRIRDPRLAQLAQRIAVSYHLSPLSADETREYIRHRLRSAGSLRDDIFTPEAMDLVHAKSKGIPRTINILCDAALVYAYADEVPTVDQHLMKQTIEDREEEGVVRDGAVWVDPEAVSGNGSGNAKGSQEAMNRIFSLESRVAEIAVQLNWQLSEMQARLDEGKDGVVQKLTELLSHERKKSDKLLMKFSHYRLKSRKMSGEHREIVGSITQEAKKDTAETGENYFPASSHEQHEDDVHMHPVPRTGFFRRLLSRAH